MLNHWHLLIDPEKMKLPTILSLLVVTLWCSIEVCSSSGHIMLRDCLTQIP
jgi:hypothetical protein